MDNAGRASDGVLERHEEISGAKFLPGEAGEVPRRGGGVMSTSHVAHDPLCL